VVTLHHIASDGWSASILVRELVELYGAYVEVVRRAGAIGDTICDYAIWQRGQLEGSCCRRTGVLESSGGGRSLAAPTDYMRPAVQSTRGASLQFKIDAALAESLRRLSWQEGASLYIDFAGGSRCCCTAQRQEDICVGSPIAGRTAAGVEGLIGFLSTALVMRSRVSDLVSFGIAGSGEGNDVERFCGIRSAVREGGGRFIGGA